MALTMSTDDARELVYGGDFSDEGLTVIARERLGDRRWESENRVIVRDRDGNFWSATYRQGLTEMQDSRPFEDQDEVTFTQVEPHEVLTVEYRPLSGPLA